MKNLFSYMRLVPKLINREYLSPPIFGMINDKMDQEREGIYFPFSKCGLNKNIGVVFDIGANVGDISSIAARSFPNAKIYSFEPVSSSYNELCKNLEEYGNRIHTYNFGFYNIKKKANINITSFHGANSLLHQSKKHKDIHPHITEIMTEKIDLLTMDSFVLNNNINKIDVVKIDVEGVEKEVIEGGVKTFKNRVDNLLIELSFIRRNHDPQYWIEICRLLYDLGFVLVNIYDIARYSNDVEYIIQMDAFFTKKNNPSIF